MFFTLIFSLLLLHAWHNRSDPTNSNNDVLNSNSRAPCGARHNQSAATNTGYQFQLTRPMRGATRERRNRSIVITISTHAPHAGRDRDFAAPAMPSINFNSRAPCGARLKMNAPVIRANPFQLTRPMRGATSCEAGSTSSYGISTHAPHAGELSPLYEL